ncbi:SPOR domain-containing protein [Formosa sp. A9]|uniref:SPOR domain-containing protein n=1 Tax=Formosa sp. A9 TaxID=3442641 RepID=UPI003EBE393E
MKLLNFKIAGLTAVCVFTLASTAFAQQGSLAINQDQEINKLLEVKKEMDKDENASDRFKIQIYSGNRANAEKTQKDFGNKFDQWKSTLVYETPNYKVWIGSFRSRLEADRALIDIKKEYPNGFIFKPKKAN